MTPKPMGDPAAITLRPWHRNDVPALIDIFAASTDLATQYPLPVTDETEARLCLQKMLATVADCWEGRGCERARVPWATTTIAGRGVTMWRLPPVAVPPMEQ